MQRLSAQSPLTEHYEQCAAKRITLRLKILRLSRSLGLAIAAAIGFCNCRLDRIVPCYTTISPIGFLPGQATVDAAGRATLDRLCECLHDNSYQNLTLLGSSHPTEAGSHALAARRAYVVKKYLVEGPCALSGERLSDQGSISGDPAIGGKVTFRVQK